MSSLVDQLTTKGLLKTPPSFLKNNTQLEVITGSVAYGVSSDTSDMDVVGFCIPSRDVVFPHLSGKIEGFGTPPPAFNQFQQHHIQEGHKEYDIAIYSIVKFFQLCMENNPNMVDVLFVPRRCVLYSTGVGELVRENRKLFLSKACWPKFKGYAYSQLHKMQTKVPEGKRVATVEEHGFDVKFAYHVVRLLEEVHQILTMEDLDLEMNREMLKTIRRGEWKPEDVSKYFASREKQLELDYQNSKLPNKAPEAEIKGLLLKCLEHHYGSLDKAYVETDSKDKALRDIQDILSRVI